MSYERYKNFRLAPDDQDCWDVLDKDYQQVLTFPSKAAAKRYIDERTEHDEDDLGNPLYPASLPSNGGGSQDSIDRLVQQVMIQSSTLSMRELILAWHNTQLKEAYTQGYDDCLKEHGAVFEEED